MRALTRRRILSGVLACCVLAAEASTAEPARADLLGGDIPILLGILGNAISTVVQLTSMLTQISYQVRMLETMIRGLDHASFTSVVQFIGAARMSFNSLTWGIRSMSYTLNRIDQEFSQLFPAAHPAAAPPAQHQQRYRQWHQEIVSASQVASRQQTTVSTLDDHATKVADILQQSQANSGQVAAQLQLVVQSLGLVVHELITLNQTLATTGRVLTDVAAAEASGKVLSAQVRQDNRAGYTDKGPPTAVPHALP